MLIINNVKLPLDYDFSDLTYAAAKGLKPTEKILKVLRFFVNRWTRGIKTTFIFAARCLFQPKTISDLKKTARNYIVTQSTYGKKQAIPICALWLRGSALRECLPL